MDQSHQEKTTLSLQVIAEAQKKGGICAFIDAEHALDPVYAKKLGVNTTELLISQPVQANKR
jgi:recombination protein RecA